MKHALLFVLALCAASACDLNTTTQPSNPSAPGGTTSTAVSYTVIGASDAVGYGSSVPCVPFTECPDGRGYAQLLTQRLKADGRQVAYLNLGLPGGVLGPETQAIGNQIGRDILTNFLENEVPFVAKNSTLVTVFAGGNDANTIGAALEAGQGGSDPNAYLAARVAKFAADLKTLVAGIKSRAPSARIVVLNLPNLAALPYASSYSTARKKTLQTISVQLSAQINALRTSDGTLVVDLMCDPAIYQPGTYSSDGFHPNDAGYAHLADVLYGPATTGQAAPPAASCSQMTVY